MANIFIIEYCPKDGDEKEAHLFYDSLLENHKPSEFSSFVDTKVFFNFTFKNIAELSFLVDACVLAAKKALNEDIVRYWSFRGFMSVYLACYLGYNYIYNR